MVEDSSDFEAPDGRGKRTKKAVDPVSNKKAKKAPAKAKKKLCPDCDRDLNSPNLVFFPGPVDGAVEDEFVALVSDEVRSKSLVSSSFDQVDLNDDPRQEYRLNDFTFYDESGHLVSFDRDSLPPQHKLVFATGFIRGIVHDDGGAGGVAAARIGPVNWWWVGGFTSGEKTLLGVSTEVAHYYLDEPSSLYRPVFLKIYEKCVVSKVVVEKLIEARERDEELTYDDLIYAVEDTLMPEGCAPMSSETLTQHAAFVLSQIDSYEDGGDDTEERFMLGTPAVQRIVKITGLAAGKRKQRGHVRRGAGPKKDATSKEVTFSKATTTPLIREVFEECFSEQMAAGDAEAEVKLRKKRCGVCEKCQAVNCGKCAGCKDMVRFGGSGKSKQACKHRICENMSIVDFNDSLEDEEEVKKPPELLIKDCFIKLKPVSRENSKFSAKWVGNSAGQNSTETFYNQVLVNNEENSWKVGDFVRASDGAICKIVYLFEKSLGFYAHLQEYVFGGDTILKEMSDKRELFELKSCYNSKISAIKSKVEVLNWKIPGNWAMIGGTEEGLEHPPMNCKYFYRSSYNPKTARFETAEDPGPMKAGDCPVCLENVAKNNDGKVKPFGCTSEDDSAVSAKKYQGFVLARGVICKVGDAVFITPKTTTGSRGGLPKFPTQEGAVLDLDEVDQVLYPEYYRKNENVKGWNENTNPPLDIGIIQEITKPQGFVGTEKLRVTVRCLYRPNQVDISPDEAFSKDFNYLYWSDDVKNVDPESIKGKCFVRSDVSLDCPITKWMDEGEHRFYFDKMYDRSTKTFSELPTEAETFGMSKGKNGKKSKPVAKDLVKCTEDGKLPVIRRPLRALDVFAGCGGLSHGLKQAGVAESKWAIEVVEPAAEAYKKNEPNCAVFTEDCNAFLKLAMADPNAKIRGKLLPHKGEVELLCGGPPCQGFSGMNRFNSGEYSKFKNSLISSYLSFCDYYRPRFFILENVRNFASYKKNMILKLCLRALVKMGYQTSFAILQAGHYGVAQTRRRCILLAAAPGEKLPNFPEPLHAFDSNTLVVNVNGESFSCDWQFTDHAPYRTVTVRDTMSDLPEIENGCKDNRQSYGLARSHFQRLMRKDMTSEYLTDHVCKEMSPLVVARMSYIPITPGSDWRDLPNKRVLLSDKTMTDVLEYNHDDHEKGKHKDGRLRGVCCCATSAKAKCRDQDRQTNTLIPWCLPHTSNRHNNWAGLYGRLTWDGFFSTTVTNPEPMGKQGRVLHPEQHRLVSVRECARSQGFSDDFHFHGTILEKHRQVGNAVPPPMGKAIGLEIRKAMASKEGFKSNVLTIGLKKEEAD